MFFVLPGKGAALLGLTDIELLYLFNMSCSTIDTSQENKLINTQQTEAEYSTNNNSKINSTAISNFIVDNFLLGPNRKAEEGASEKLTKMM